MNFLRATLSAVVILIVVPPCYAETRVLDGKMHHLRSGAAREWADFPATAEGDRLTVVFDGKRNKGEQTLRLRHRDCKHAWRVTLNGRELGRLPRDENDMAAIWSIAPGGLVDGENKLLVVAAGKRDDDILIGEVKLDPMPVDELLNQAQINVSVLDENKSEIPCRLTIVDENGTLIPLGAKSNDNLAVRHGMIYTRNGSAQFGLPAGQYTIYAGRGFEYSIQSELIRVDVGDIVKRSMAIRREVDTRGYVSCDTHVHTLTFSGHGDASVEERMLSIAGEGLELPIATDHNVHTDYEPYARKLNVRRYFTPVIGNEVTTPVGHFNAFPIQADAAPPDHRSGDWAVTFANIEKTPGVKMIVLNHARDLHSGHRPFGFKHHNGPAGQNLDGWELKANAMEVVNSAALQTDVMQLFHDWLGLLNRGLRITPIGGSDSHEVARKLVSQGRTYIECPDADPGKIDVELAMRHLQQGRVLVSMGLLTKITVDEQHRPGDLAPAGERVKVAVSVQGPTWTHAKHVALYANGVKIREAEIPITRKPKVIKWSGSWQIDRPAHDANLVAIATGPGVTAPYWRIPKSYQPTSPVWRPYVVGVTGAVWLDADGDGKWTSAFDYASRLMEKTGGNLTKLMSALGDYDEAVAIQAANQLAMKKQPPVDPNVQAALKDSSSATQRGFRRFLESWRASEQARLE